VSDARRSTLAVLISGGGRSMVNLHERCEDGTIPAKIGVVLASGDVGGVAKARALGLPVVVERGTIPAERLEALLAPFGVDFIVLAGYLKLLRLPAKFRGRATNIHPALLPKFGGPGMYGHHVHGAVLAAGERESGCTVHLVDDTYDTGPIVVQRRCPVLPGDTPETLAARVFEQELIAYPQALRRLLNEGGR
jgi:phosphoribosylglycinamide formyltransferase-1